MSKWSQLPHSLVHVALTDPRHVVEALCTLVNFQEMVFVCIEVSYELRCDTPLLLRFVLLEVFVHVVAHILTEALVHDVVLLLEQALACWCVLRLSVLVTSYYGIGRRVRPVLHSATVC